MSLFRKVSALGDCWANRYRRPLSGQRLVLGVRIRSLLTSAEECWGKADPEWDLVQQAVDAGLVHIEAEGFWMWLAQTSARMKRGADDLLPLRDQTSTESC